MKYTVVWKPAAEDELARIWTNATNKAAVTSAANQIERDLQSDPKVVGESRPGSTRIHFALPLGIQYRIAEAHPLVYVLRVWRVRSR